MVNVPSPPGSPSSVSSGRYRQHQPVLGQLVGDGQDGGPDPRVLPGQEAGHRQQQQRGVQRPGLVVLGEHATVVHPVGQDVRPDLVGRLAPGLGQRRLAPGQRGLRPALHRRPAHQLGEGEVLRRAAHLPDAQVRFPPVLQRRLHLAAHHRPDPAVQPLPAAQPDVDGLQHGAPHVVLALGVGLVADPHRPGPVVPGELVEDPLAEHPLAVHPVHHLDLVVPLGDVSQEPEEVVGLPVEAERVQAPQGERGVAQPAVPVVPVALAVRHLGQRRGGRGDHGAARRERQALQRQRAALQVPAPRMVREAAPGQPVLPVVRGPDQPRAAPPRS